MDGVDGAGWGPPEPLRGRSCQILTKWKEKPEKRLIRGEGRLGPRECWRRLVPTEPFSSQRGQALPISSVAVIALQQRLLPFSASLTVPAACGFADQNLVRNLDGVRDLVCDGVKPQV